MEEWFLIGPKDMPCSSRRIKAEEVILACIGLQEQPLTRTKLAIGTWRRLDLQMEEQKLRNWLVWWYDLYARPFIRFGRDGILATDGCRPKSSVRRRYLATPERHGN